MTSSPIVVIRRAFSDGIEIQRIICDPVHLEGIVRQKMRFKSIRARRTYHNGLWHLSSTLEWLYSRETGLETFFTFSWVTTNCHSLAQELVSFPSQILDLTGF